jgi:hypothetical protein
MKRSFLPVVVAGAVVTIVVLAQSTSTAPTIAQQVAQRVAQLTTLLDLTAGQQTTATTIFTTELTALSAIQASQQTAQTALTTAIKADNSTGITAAAETLGGLATQQAEAQGTGEAAFYVILTSAQQAKYDILGDNGGPGGPPGPQGPQGGHPGPPGASGASGYTGSH